MAKRYDPTSQDYPETLGMPSKGKDNALASQYYGFSDDQIQQMKKAGITVGDLQGMGILHPPEMMTPAQNYYSGSQGGGSGGTIGGQVMSQAGRQQLQNAAMLKASLATSSANQPQQQPATSAPTAPQSYLGDMGGQTYGTPSQTPIQSPITIPKGYNLYSPPPVSGIGAMSDLAVQPPLVQPLGSNFNLGQANRQGGSFLG